MFDVKALLHDCCADEDTRYMMSTPWLTKDGWTVATDGRICVRTRHDIGAETREAAPPIGDLGWDREFHPDPLILPSTIDVDRHFECEECCGSGFVLCNLHHEHECDHCDGHGTVPHWRDFDFGVVMLNEEYLAIVKKHGGTIFARTERDRGPVHIVFDNKTDGILMHMDRVGVARGYTDVINCSEGQPA